MSETSPDMTVIDVTEVLQQKFPDAIQPDDREGYSGLVVSADKLA